MQNPMFFENFAEQTNLLVACDDEKKADLVRKIGNKIKEIKMVKPVKKAIP